MYIDDTQVLVDSDGSVDAVLERYRRLMRALHFAKAARGIPWAECPLTFAQLRALALLAGSGHGLSGRELASALGVGPSAVTPLMDRLVEHGLARREEDRADRRITRLFVTDAGLAQLERLVAGTGELMREVLAGLRPAELATVGRAFALLLERVQQIAAGADLPAAVACAAPRP